MTYKQYKLIIPHILIFKSNMNNNNLPQQKVVAELFYKRILISLLSSVSSDKRKDLVEILRVDNNYSSDQLFNYLNQHIPDYQKIIIQDWIILSQELNSL